VRVWNLAASGCAAVVLAVSAAGCGSSSSTTTSSTNAKPATTSTTASTPTNPNQFGEISLTSSAFKNGQPLPAAYTCAGADISPPLEWKKIPAEAKELFIVGLEIRKTGRTKVVWAIGGIPATDAHISAGTIPKGAVLGENQTGKPPWGGVCGATKGERDRIAFLVYALRSSLHLKANFDPIAIRPQLKAATISTGLTIASYKRS
jgi:phosphatidylethanolamine-binding protein (PEBP) family uncharacterized protein